MSIYSIKADLLKIKGAFLTNLKGETAVKRCLVIPIDEAGLYLGEKGCYLNLTSAEMREPKYGDTHVVKVSVPKEQYEAMSEDERRNIPIIGGMRAIEVQPAQMPVENTIDQSAFVDDDDLPF